MRNSEKREFKVIETKVKGGDLENDVDALFRLPLAEFTDARNTLAARLKKSSRGDEKTEAVRVKALGKPPLSAWAVNQLYWNHRETFDRLLASGEQFHKAQTSGKIAEMRTALDARRATLAQLSDLATSLLRAGGHSPSPDTIHRVTTTLEAISAYASRSDGPRPGRLTHDVDPPGFESFASFVPSARLTQPGKEPTREPTRPTPSPKSASVVTNPRGKAATDHDVRQAEETRKAKRSAAEAALQDAKRSLKESRARVLNLEAARKKADAEVKRAEKQKRDAEEELRNAKAAAEDAAQLARSVAAELKDAARAVDDAESTVEKASKELDSLSRESSGR